MQGAMQGALFGARSLATGLGPVIFAALFTLFSRSDSSLPYFPGAHLHPTSCLSSPALPSYVIWSADESPIFIAEHALTSLRMSNGSPPRVAHAACACP
jgi:hypothetical protein